MTAAESFLILGYVLIVAGVTGISLTVSTALTSRLDDREQ